MFFSENELLLELLGVFKIERKKSYLDSVNDRSYDSLSIRLSGAGTFCTTDKTYTVKRGDLLYLPQNAHYRHSTSGETIIAIHFINYSYNKKNTIEILTINHYTEAENLVQNMYHIWNEKKQGYQYLCLSILYQLLYLLNQQAHNDYIQSVNPNEKIKAAIDYIHTHFRSEQISISKLARLSAVSETYFRKLFQKIYSVPPSQYIICLRLEYASQLLQSKLYTVSEVSEKAGFNDTKYFSKLFKRHYHKSPSKYQNLNLEKNLK